MLNAAILSEAYSYATFEERILASLYFVEEIINCTFANAKTIQDLTVNADKTNIIGTSGALRAQYTRSDDVLENTDYYPILRKPAGH